MGSTVDVTDGLRAHLAAPRQGAGLGLLVVHDRSGVTSHIEDVCDRFAGEGFTAVAPDLYSGAVAEQPERADEPRSVLESAEAVGLLGAAVDHLVASPSVRGEGIGVVGFGLGARLALELSTGRPSEVRACVGFYGPAPWPPTTPGWSSLQAPVHLHLGENDQLVAPAQLGDLAAELSDLGKDVEVFVYPDAGHGFFDDSRFDSFNTGAASLAWTRTLEFLRAKLG